MEKLQRPREETVDNYRKNFYKSDYGINAPEYSYEQFLDQFKDDIEEHGLVMDKAHVLGLIMKEDGIAKTILGPLQDVEGVLIDWKKYILESMHSDGTTFVIGGGLYDLSHVISILKVLGWEGTRYYQTGEGMEAKPMVFVNTHQEAITLCPCMHGDGIPKDAMTYEVYTDGDLDNIRERVKILEDPDLIELETLNYDHNERRQVFKLSEVVKVGRLGDEEYGVQIGEVEHRLDEYNLNKVREALPDVEYVDARHIYEFDAEELTNNAKEAWLKRDPIMEDHDLFIKCLDDLFEKAKYGQSLGGSLDFYVKMFPSTPPRPENKHRSIHQPGEWAQPIIEAIRNNIVRLEYSPASVHREEDTIWSKGLLKLWFDPNNVDLDLPGVIIKDAEYKATHLQQFITDVEFYASSAPWPNWETKTQISEFEHDEVRA